MEKFLYNLETFLKTQMNRKGFLKVCCAVLLAFITGNQLLKAAFAKSEDSSGRPKKGLKGLHDIVAVKGGDPYQNTVKAVEQMGGIGRFVKKGDVVVVKPNMAWDRTPRQAANTDPMVVAALVELCYKAGAKRVNVFDIPCNEDRPVYEHSGIAAAAKEKGAFVYFADHWNVVKAKFSYNSSMEGWPVLRDAVVCDTFINVPVLKHHGYTKLTLSMKNLMGVCSGKRGLIHLDIGTKLVDMTDFINPDLTVIDATRVLLRNGPSGGNESDVQAFNTVIAATDPTLADVYACSLVKIDPAEIPYLKAAMARGVGRSDLTQADVLEVQA
ncbi:MAG TPA: DUF362 domain-containing protein [Candidatus Omnitrophota bacterium]|nr:DUF362 domain-containing protein [Candidatus Omnitrophota bacterium]